MRLDLAIMVIYLFIYLFGINKKYSICLFFFDACASFTNHTHPVRFVSKFRKDKMKNAPLPKISQLVKNSGEI